MENNQHPAKAISHVRLYSVHGRVHRLLASVADVTLLSDVDSHHLFLVQNEDGHIGPPRTDVFTALIEQGIVVPIECAPRTDVDLERMELIIGILKTAKVRNGEKAIWLHLNAVWSDDLLRRYGPFDDPATIRRWRTAHRKAAKTAERMERPDA